MYTNAIHYYLLASSPIWALPYHESWFHYELPVPYYVFFVIPARLLLLSIRPSVVPADYQRLSHLQHLFRSSVQQFLSAMPVLIGCFATSKAHMRETLLMARIFLRNLTSMSFWSSPVMWREATRSSCINAKLAMKHCWEMILAQSRPYSIDDFILWFLGPFPPPLSLECRSEVIYDAQSRRVILAT